MTIPVALAPQSLAYVMPRVDVPVIVDHEQARQLAQQELAKSQYHRSPGSPSPSIAPPSPSPAPAPHPSPSHAGTIVLIILAALILLFALWAIVRRIGKPRGEKKPDRPAKRKSAGSTAEELLTGAALHRRKAQIAADAGDFAEAIRERFRAVIATLDERDLLPERADRTADEAARDAGTILPAHRSVLVDAARAFDEVEYGKYVGTPEAYAVISNVDELLRTEAPGTLQMPTAVATTTAASAPTQPGGIQ